MAAELDQIKRARLIIVQSALSMTKIGQPMRRACILWYVDGMQPHQAAKAVKRPRQHVHRALRTLQPHLEEVQREVERHGAKL